MDLYELQLKQLIEIKLLRVTKPTMNISNSLSGSYNSQESLIALDKISDTKLEKKLTEFLINDYESVSIDNMFLINNSFGKVFYGENFETLMILNNKSDSQINIRELKVKLSNEPLEKMESYYKKTKSNLFTNSDPITIEPWKFTSQKLKFHVDNISKYSVEVEILYNSKIFDDEYNRHAVNKMIKTVSSQYYIDPNKNTVMSKFYKRYVFAANIPFKIKEKIITDSMDKALIEVNLTNSCPYLINVDGISLMSDKEESGIESLNDEVYPLAIEPEEELNLVYTVNKHDTLLNINNFNLRIVWKLFFDSIEKSLYHHFKNKIINDFFSISLLEKPSDRIIYDSYLKIKFQILNKSKKSLILRILCEKNHENELDIIDTIYSDELQKDGSYLLKENEFYQITFVCKAHWKGNIFFPKLTVIEEGSKKTFPNEKLLNFNCI